MIDPKILREKPEAIRQNLSLRGAKFDLDSLLSLDQSKRKLTGELDSLKALRNQVSAEVAKIKREGGDATEVMEKSRQSGEQLKGLQDEYNSVELQWNDLMLCMPNLLHASVPKGKNSSENPVRRTWGEKKSFDFKAKDHLELGKTLQLFDFERGAKISGSGFPVYTGRGAKLERSLINFFLDSLSSRFGFTEMQPPLLVNRQSMQGTGQLPKFEEDMYRCAEDAYYLIPTAEVPLTNLHSGEVFQEEQLPINYCGYTPCFRREAGTWGKETRGFLRLHQFDKVEMVRFASAETSYALHEEMVQCSEWLLQQLELQYRVIELCSGDIGFGAAKCYDIEVYAPKEERWLEVSSVSNFEDFQARRANIRVKQGPKMNFVHTLNGSALATPRVLVALLETHQQADGTIILPQVLESYMGGDRKLKL